MIKLNIMDINNFLITVNECRGSVNVLDPDGKKININKHFEFQNQLFERYRNNKNCLSLTLDIRDSSDYMRIVSYYAGDR